MNTVIIILISVLIGYYYGWLVCAWGVKKRFDEKNKIEAQQYKEPKITGIANVFKDRRGKWRFNITSMNRKIVAASQAYSTKRNAVVGVHSLMKTCSRVKLVKEK